MNRRIRFANTGGIALLIALALALVGGTVAQAADPTPTPDAHASHHGGATTPAATTTACAGFGSTPATGTMGDMGGMMGTPGAGMAMNQEFDLMFIDMMIAHHESAVAMAKVAVERGEHQEVRDLGQAIIDSQQAEIDRMRAWRDAWYPGAAAMPMDQMTQMMGDMMSGMSGMMGTPDSGMGGMIGTPAMGNGSMMGGSGMMSMMDPQAEAQALCAAAGPFDQAFLQMMIPHHQSAVMMAQVALQRATHPELKQLAQSIIDAQTREIAEMTGWLQSWYGVSAGATATP